MKKAIACEGCGKEYSLDLEKYGGKKVRCKQCEAVIAVPMPLDDDEFEVVEEEEAGSAIASSARTLEARQPLSPLDDEQLKRPEQARADIRRSILESLGAWKQAAERRSAALSGELDEYRSKVEAAKDSSGDWRMSMHERSHSRQRCSRSN